MKLVPFTHCLKLFTLCALTFSEDLLTCFSLHTLLWSHLIPWNFSDHQALPCHILHSDFACVWKISINWCQSKPGLRLNRDFMNYTEDKKRCCGFLWVGSESKGLWCLCREGKLVLIPHPEGRLGSLCDGHGNGEVIFGTTALCCSGLRLALQSSGSLHVGRGWIVKLQQEAFL